MDPASAPWRVFEVPDAAAPTSDAGGPPGRRSTRAELPRPAVAAAAVLIVMLVGLALVLAFGERPGGSVVVGAGSGATASTGVTAEVLVVDVGGAVLHPGVVRLPAGARVGDAIAAAGGYGPRVDAARAAAQLNLAAPIADGDRVTVPSRDDRSPGPGAAPGTGAGGGSSPSLVNLNTASTAELEALPGIGPATAAKILAARATRPFGSVQELRERKLVGQKTFDALRSLVTVR